MKEYEKISKRHMPSHDMLEKELLQALGETQ
jgi:hypothetical protein